MIAAFQYKLYPTNEQEATLLETLETLRHLYNNALGERIDAYQHEHRNVNYGDQANLLPTLKKRAPSLTNVYSQVAQDCMRRLHRAYENFFRRVKSLLSRKSFEPLHPFYIFVSAKQRCPDPKNQTSKSSITIQPILENPNPNRKTRILIRTLKNLDPTIHENQVRSTILESQNVIHHPKNLEVPGANLKV